MMVQGELYPAMSCWHGFGMALGSQATLKYLLYWKECSIVWLVCQGDAVIELKSV